VARFTTEEILRATGGELVAGSSIAKFCGVSTDSRTLRRGELFIAIKGKSFDGHNFIKDAIKKGAAGIIVQCDIAGLLTTYDLRLTTIKVPDTTKALGGIAHYHRTRFDIPVIAITGSNGKTTTKELTAHILKKKFNILNSAGTENNNIGVPKTLFGLSRCYEAVVLELGTNAFGEMRNLAGIAAPTIGVITNIGPSHLEGLGSLGGVFREKMELFSGFSKGAVAIINGDDPYLAKVSSAKYRVIRFGTKANADFRAKGISFDGRGSAFSLNGKIKFRLNLLGRQNVYDALAAIAIAGTMGLTYAQIRGALLTFAPMKMRMEELKRNGVRIINDAYNSNPLSLREAISWLGAQQTPGRKFLVAADMLELGEDARRFHRAAGEFAALQNIDYVICYGKLSRSICEGAIDGGIPPQRAVWFNAANPLADVASLLKELLRPRDILLVKGSRAMKMEELIRCFTTS